MYTTYAYSYNYIYIYICDHTHDHMYVYIHAPPTDHPWKSPIHYPCSSMTRRQTLVLATSSPLLERQLSRPACLGLDRIWWVIHLHHMQIIWGLMGIYKWICMKLYSYKLSEIEWPSDNLTVCYGLNHNFWWENSLFLEVFFLEPFGSHRYKVVPHNSQLSYSL